MLEFNRRTIPAFDSLSQAETPSLGESGSIQYRLLLVHIPPICKLFQRLNRKFRPECVKKRIQELRHCHCPKIDLAHLQDQSL